MAPAGVQTGGYANRFVASHAGEVRANAGLAQLPQDVAAVDVGQPGVEDDGIKVASCRERESGRPGCGGIDGECVVDDELLAQKLAEP